MKRRRSGAMLLEVVAALAILAVAGISLLSLARSTIASVHQAGARDRETREASALLDAVALWSDDDLNRRIGRNGQGRWLLDLGRVTSSVYSVTVRDSAGSMLLETYLYRRESYEVADAR